MRDALGHNLLAHNELGNCSWAACPKWLPTKGLRQALAAYYGMTASGIVVDSVISPYRAALFAVARLKVFRLIVYVIPLIIAVVEVITIEVVITIQFIVIGIVGHGTSP
jgi:hypothetical protein